MLEYFARRLPEAAREARSAAPLPLSLADIAEQRIVAAGQLPIADGPSVLGCIIQSGAKQVENVRASRAALGLRLSRSGPLDARADVGGLLAYERALGNFEKVTIGAVKRALATAAAARVRLSPEVLESARAACGSLNSVDGRPQVTVDDLLACARSEAAPLGPAEEMLLRLRHAGLLRRAELLAGIVGEVQEFCEDKNAQNTQDAAKSAEHASAAVETTLSGLICALQRCKCFKPSVDYSLLSTRPGPVGIAELANSINSAQPTPESDEYDAGKAVLPAVEALLHPEQVYGRDVEAERLCSLLCQQACHCFDQIQLFVPGFAV